MNEEPKSQRYDKADPTNPKDLIGHKKPPLNLVPPALLIHTSMAMADGARKYGAYNWRLKQVRYTVYLAAIERHLAALKDGEDDSSDAHTHHAAHIAACCAIILDAMEGGNLIDDRPAKGPAAAIIKKFTTT